MNELFELIDFFQKTKIFSQKVLQNSMEKAGFDKNKFTLLTKQVSVIEEIQKLILEHENCDAKFLLKQINLDEKNLDLYIKVLEVVSPGIIKFKHLANQDFKKEFLQLIQTSVANTLKQKQVSKKQIAKRLNLSESKVNKLMTTLPAVSEMNKQIKSLKEENLIREYFAVKPYTTIKDASKQLKMPHLRVRTIVEELRYQGEDIKFNNTPAVFEREELYANIIKIKKENPALTNKELALSLGVSPKQVTIAMNSFLKTFQREKKQNVGFYFDNMLSDLRALIDYAWERSNASKSTSSRWAEINLMAQEKIIRVVGLNAPEKYEVSGGISVSKFDRDKVIEGYVATDVTDIDFELVEVTGSD